MDKDKKSANSVKSDPGASYQPAKQMTITTIEQLKAISDPLRLSILEMIAKQALTVKQIASKLGQPPTKLYYHMAELEAGGFVAMVETRVKSGIIEKYYRVSAESITIDRALLNPETNKENGLAYLLSMVFDATMQDFTRTAAAKLINMDNINTGEIINFFLIRCLTKIRSENVGLFLQKLKNLVDDLGVEDEQAGPDGINYGLMVAFYPRVDESDTPDDPTHLPK